MNAIIDDPLPSETLTPEEIRELSGCCRRRSQIEWLKKNGWVYLLNRAGKPIIGRQYARMRLAGIAPAGTNAPNDAGWQLDMSKVR